MSDASGPGKGLLTRAALGRVRAALWRFQTLPYAERLFERAAIGTVLSRPYCGYRLYLDISRTNAQRLLFLEGERFMCERPVLETLVQVDGTVVDVGANLGYYALFFAQRIGAGGRLVLVEPEPDNVIELKRNIALNGLVNAEILEMAAGQSSGTVRMRRGVNGAVMVGGDDASAFSVPIARLDAIVRHKVSLLKVDVEGYEGQVLEGASGLLADSRPSLFVEVHPALMVHPHSVASVVEGVRRFYSRLEAYVPAAPSDAWGKLGVRYRFRGGCDRVNDIGELVLASMRGERQVPFWLVARR